MATFNVTFTPKAGSNKTEASYDGVADVKFTGASLIVLVYDDKRLIVKDLSTWETVSVTPESAQ